MSDEELRIEPGAAERIATAFSTYADGLEAATHRLRDMGFSTGLAGFPSAEELNVGFLRKRNQAIEHLTRLADDSRQHAESVRAAGRAYVETENVATTTIQSAADMPNGPTP